MLEQWLVIAHTAQGTVPMLLCETAEEAKIYGGRLTDTQVRDRARLVWNVATATVRSVEAVQFISGVPVLSIGVPQRIP